MCWRRQGAVVIFSRAIQNEQGSNALWGQKEAQTDHAEDPDQYKVNNKGI